MLRTLLYKYTQLFIVVIFLSTSVAADENKLVVVVNVNSNEMALTKKQLTDIYMGRYQNFPSGGSAFPVDFPDNSRIKQTFYKLLVKQTEKRINSYWSRLLFSGSARPPHKAEGIDDVVSIVEQNEKAIAYLPVGHVSKKMRVVYRFE
ncbi:hypothetical protein J3L16_02590 [Alteromonas sp. 5E99-2]|uniref:hypothetical protein n=1 Tax=Alteromonas sp. 5E99-2 TaxID=2817683 RepID=UPI001A988BD3|nr:hypothetical protein [Alteromonas sp. 5E99-2]MBO1254572.1 hypothetical protein [Alteromonas sp. 5E99-2]